MQEAEKAVKDAQARNEAIMRGNPLLDMETAAALAAGSGTIFPSFKTSCLSLEVKQCVGFVFLSCPDWRGDCQASMGRRFDLSQSGNSLLGTNF